MTYQYKSASMVFESMGQTACRQVELPEVWPGGPVGGRRAWDVLNLTQHLRQSYCGSLAVEMDHLTRYQHALMHLKLKRRPGTSADTGAARSLTGTTVDLL